MATFSPRLSPLTKTRSTRPNSELGSWPKYREMRLFIETRGCSVGWIKHNRPIELAEGCLVYEDAGPSGRARTHTSRFDERKATSLAGGRDGFKRKRYRARQQAAAVFWQKMQVVKVKEEEEEEEHTDTAGQTTVMGGRRAEKRCLSPRGIAPLQPAGASIALPV
ncbi:hypothetical protein TEQG_06158 [Trichophyton equinum CBS 127.97]|uniref:Uncharacterized protein n=1 Tax=Trichophyton equinum (strain ATCC MYA-4606 / CBS 127.97) TaxID=559882 RepID=F2PZ53_TRIEC|nr:hypothetical protein TEQG_06158 [Trichophyton equinum CBS 127.97]